MKKLTLEEAIHYSDELEKGGLMHLMGNFAGIPDYVMCNCCECCCAVLGPAIRSGRLRQMYSPSRYVAAVDTGKMCRGPLAGSPGQSVERVPRDKFGHADTEIVIEDRDKINTFWAGVLIVDAIHQLYPDRFEWRERHFDRLCGTDQVRIAITEHKPLSELKTNWHKDIQEFLKIRKKYLLY